MQTLGHWIDGAEVAGEGDTLENINPATGECINRIPAGDTEAVDQAVAAAQRAFESWRLVPAAERAALLHAVADAVERDAEAFAAAECADTGKPIALASSVDIPRAVANLRWFADAAVEFCAREEVWDTTAARSTVDYRPAGPVAAISPWNLPLYLLSWKIAPALAMGCTVVAKPSEITPTTASMLAHCSAAAGVPAGVLNILHGLGDRSGAPLVSHRDIKAVTFTGGTATGRRVAESCAGAFKKVALEMGGKNPCVIFADADLDAALDVAAAAAFSNQGQICLCTERLIVEASIKDDVIAGLVARANALRIGDPTAPTTQFGSLTSHAHRDKVAAAVDQARNDGATVHCGGEVPTNTAPGGAFYAPTVLSGLGSGSVCNQTEIFGPVTSIIPFETEAQAIHLANDTDYGLCATVCSGDRERAQRVAHRIDAGTVWINCWLVRDFRVPFGGMKHSGLGREGGETALRFFTEPVTMCATTGSQQGAAGAVPSEST